MKSTLSTVPMTSRRKRVTTVLRAVLVAMLLATLSLGAFTFRPRSPEVLFRCVFGATSPAGLSNIRTVRPDPQYGEWMAYARVEGDEAERARLMSDLQLDSDEARRRGYMFGIAAFEARPGMTWWPNDLQVEPVDVRFAALPAGDVYAAVRPTALFLILHAHRAWRPWPPGFECAARQDRAERLGIE